MSRGIDEVYGNMVRVRVCGVCWHNGSLLMVNHRGLLPGQFWAPPGGGIEFGESAEVSLQREFREETGLEVSINRFLFACEFIRDPLHALELFFDVSITGGRLQKGDDPEFPTIDEVRFMLPSEITALSPSQRHGIFGRIPSPENLKILTGFYAI